MEAIPDARVMGHAASACEHPKVRTRAMYKTPLDRKTEKTNKLIQEQERAIIHARGLTQSSDLPSILLPVYFPAIHSPPSSSHPLFSITLCYPLIPRVC